MLPFDIRSSCSIHCCCDDDDVLVAMSDDDDDDDWNPPPARRISAIDTDDVSWSSMASLSSVICG